LKWPMTTKKQWLDSMVVAKQKMEQANYNLLAGKHTLMERWVLHPLRNTLTHTHPHAHTLRHIFGIYMVTAVPWTAMTQVIWACGKI